MLKDNSILFVILGLLLIVVAVSFSIEKKPVSAQDDAGVVDVSGSGDESDDVGEGEGEGEGESTEG